MSINPSNLFVKSNNKRVSYNGYVMCGDIPVARVDDDIVTIIESELTPFYLLRTNSFIGWLETRAIDSHRANSRLLRKAIRLNNSDLEDVNVDLVIYSNAATITDNYWFKSINSVLTYDDIRFKSDYLSDIALNGNIHDMDDVYVNEFSPEFTNTGSYEKCWKILLGNWYMVKKANPKEKFSEYFTYKLGSYFGFNMAEYLVDGRINDSILSRDFTEGAMVNFEPMYSFIGNDDSYDLSYEQLHTLSEGYNVNLLTDYFNMLFLDSLVYNFDRHTFNYGILREVNLEDGTSRITGLAPNFDNNLALISKSYTKNSVVPRSFLDMFANLVINHGSDYHIPYLDIEELRSLVESSMIECDVVVNTDYVVNFVYDSYCYLRSSING